MNDLINYTFEDEAVRVVLIAGNPWWVANDIAKVLGYKIAPHMVRMLDDDEKGIHIVDTLGGQQEMNVISESGLFAAILKSRRPEAKRFRRWVTGDVLPELRRTGRYTLHDMPDPPMLPSPAIEDAELPRLTAAIGIMREARQVWGREECRRIWISIGLPNPIAQAAGEDDPFAAQVAQLTEGQSMTTTARIATAMGQTLDARLSLRIGSALRLLGWQVRKEKLDRVATNVWRRGEDA